MKKFNIITFDIETFEYNNLKYPFSIGIFQNEKFNYFYLKENKIDNISEDSELLINDAINFLFEIKNINEYIIYVHNLSKFDSFFIIKYLNKFKFKLFGRNKELYKIQVMNENKNIYFYDSFRIINLSLNDGCKIYNVDDNEKKKEINYNLFLFENIFKKEFKNEILIYLKNDCVSLYRIMYQFISKIYEEFKVHPRYYLTISSLSYKIFKKMNKVEIENNVNLKWKDKYLRDSYFGGRNEVYKPFLENGYYYDVNSLYPYVMCNNDYPVGIGKFIKWDENKNELEKFFGFLFCEIEAPYTYRPILPYKKDNTVIYPYGNFEGVYFIAELLQAKLYGYKIKPIHGISYERKNIFKEFINCMYKKRVNCENILEKNIYKLIMNSLSGRFGMHNIDININYFNEEEWDSFMKKADQSNIEILDFNQLDDDKYFIEYKKENKRNIQSSVQISSAITSYARVYMNSIVNEINENNIYYQDTDSLILNSKLSSNLVSDTELGKFKLEYEIKKCFFITQKAYSIMDNNNNKIVKFRALKEEEVKNFNEEDFKTFLKGSLSFNIKKSIRFIRNWTDLSIRSRDTILTLNLDYNKRKKIYKNYIWVNTEPIRLKKNIFIFIKNLLKNER